MPDPPELHEDVDLPLEWRRYVLDVHARLGSLDHYQLIGVARDADKKAIKAAYFRLAASVHPDRYFRKKLGSYKTKMEVIFARISVAFETLSDAKKRAAYDAALPAPVSVARAPVDPKVAAERQRAMDALKQRFVDGKAKAQQHVEAGRRAKAAGDWLAAALAYRAALDVLPNDPEIRRALEEVERGASERLVEANRKKAMLEERFGRWSKAAEAWQKVSAARPEDDEARRRLAQALARASHDG
jgi:curved DNA-binding protein CbpA